MAQKERPDPYIYYECLEQGQTIKNEYYPDKKMLIQNYFNIKKRGQMEDGWGIYKRENNECFKR